MKVWFHSFVVDECERSDSRPGRSDTRGKRPRKGGHSEPASDIFTPLSFVTAKEFQHYGFLTLIRHEKISFHSCHKYLYANLRNVKTFKLMTSA